jgi:hypothetical protein
MGGAPLLWHRPPAPVKRARAGEPRQLLSRAPAPGKIAPPHREIAVRRSVLVLALTLAACANSLDQLSSEQHKADWAAGNVYPANYRAELIAYLRTYLNDPIGIREAAVSDPALKPAGAGERYVVCVRFNPKRSGGGYAGLKDHLVIYASGKLDRYLEAAGETCKDAAYAAFPELEQLTR